MFSTEVSKHSVTNISVSTLKGLNSKSGYVQDQQQMETNFEHERSDTSVETKIKGLDKSTEQAEGAQLEPDKASEVPEKEVKPTKIQQTTIKHHTFERVTEDSTDSNTFCSPLTDQYNDMYTSEINQMSTNASGSNGHSLINECVEHNAEKTGLQDINTSQILPSELDNPINFQKKCPNTESHPETVSKKIEEKPVKHFSSDESTVGTMSLLEQIERKSDDGSNVDIQSASCDGLMQLQKPGELTLKKMDKSEDGQMLQAEQIVKASAKDANNGTYISDINLKNVTNDAVYEDKDFKSVAKTEDSVEVKQDVLSGSPVEILSPFIGQLIDSSLITCVDSVDLECTYTTNKGHKELEEVQHSKYIPDKSGLKTSKNVALVDSILQSQSSKSGSQIGLKTGNRRKLGSSRRNKGSEQVNYSVTEKDNAAKNEELETTELEEHSSGGEYRSKRNEMPKNSSDNNENAYKELNPSPHVVVSGAETCAVNEPDGCHQIKTHMDDIMSDEKSERKQRTLGTTQKLQHNSKHNEGMEEDETPQSTVTAKNEYLPASAEETILKTNQITSAQDLSKNLQCSSTDLQIIDCNLIPIINDLNSLLTEQSAFPRVEVVNLEPHSSKLADVKETLRMDVSLHASQLGSFTNTEVQMISEENTCSVSQTDTNTQCVRGSSPITEAPTSHNENEIGENLKIEQINKVDEEAQSLTSEIEILCATSTFVNRRRKMGSNRKNHKFSSRKRREEENEAIETTSDSEQKHLHRITVKQGEEQGKEVEHRLNTESYLNPKTQQPSEGNPTPPSQQGETKDQLDPRYFPSAISESQTESEQGSVGRRRKLGSHRKSRGQNYNEDRSEKTFYLEHRSRVRSDPDDGETKGTESDCPDKVPKVSKQHSDDESSKTPLSNLTLTKDVENSIIMGKQTSVQSHKAGKDIQNKIPLPDIPKEVETSSNHYNVLMIGDSNVGKTSFIKRAQSGKFSLHVPNSVGFDFCKWTVMVDGKPVSLHVWDTAGQERFRSITRQIFHKAQAFLLMYDISSSQSFSAVSYWANCIQDSASENIIILLVGNKCDREERQVRSEEGENFAKEHKFAFSECSAASGENVIECLETVARMLSEMHDSKRDASLLHNEGGKTKRSTCC